MSSSDPSPLRASVSLPAITDESHMVEATSTAVKTPAFREATRPKVPLPPRFLPRALNGTHMGKWATETFGTWQLAGPSVENPPTPAVAESVELAWRVSEQYHPGVETVGNVLALEFATAESAFSQAPSLASRLRFGQSRNAVVRGGDANHAVHDLAFDIVAGKSLGDGLQAPLNSAEQKAIEQHLDEDGKLQMDAAGSTYPIAAAALQRWQRVQRRMNESRIPRGGHA